MIHTSWPPILWNLSPSTNCRLKYFRSFIIYDPKLLLYLLKVAKVRLIQAWQRFLKLCLPEGTIGCCVLILLLSWEYLFFQLLDPDYLHAFQLTVQLFEQPLVESVCHSHFRDLRRSHNLDVVVRNRQLSVWVLVPGLECCVGYVNVTLLTIFTHLTLVVLQIYISCSLLILNWESMSIRLIICRWSYQSDFLRIFPFGTVFFLRFIILDPLQYLLFSDLRLIYYAGHCGIEPVSLFIWSTWTVFLTSECHGRLPGASVQMWDVLQGLIQVLDVRGGNRRIALMVVGFLTYSASTTSQLFILIDLSNFVNHWIPILYLRDHLRRLRREQRMIELLSL